MYFLAYFCICKIVLDNLLEFIQVDSFKNILIRLKSWLKFSLTTQVNLLKLTQKIFSTTKYILMVVYDLSGVFDNFLYTKNVITPQFIIVLFIVNHQICILI